MSSSVSTAPGGRVRVGLAAAGEAAARVDVGDGVGRLELPVDVATDPAARAAGLAPLDRSDVDDFALAATLVLAEAEGVADFLALPAADFLPLRAFLSLPRSPEAALGFAATCFFEPLAADLDFADFTVFFAVMLLTHDSLERPAQRLALYTP